jgi:hypothetical protein
MRPTSLPSFLPEHPETGEHDRTIFVDNAALRSNRNGKCRRLDVTGAPGAFQDHHSHRRHSSPLSSLTTLRSTFFSLCTLLRTDLGNVIQLLGTTCWYLLLSFHFGNRSGNLCMRTHRERTSRICSVFFFSRALPFCCCLIQWSVDSLAFLYGAQRSDVRPSYYLAAVPGFYTNRPMRVLTALNRKSRDCHVGHKRSVETRKV